MSMGILPQVQKETSRLVHGLSRRSGGGAHSADGWGHAVALLGNRQRSQLNRDCEGAGGGKGMC